MRMFIFVLVIWFTTAATGTLLKSADYSTSFSLIRSGDYEQNMNVNHASVHHHYLSACNRAGSHGPCMVDVCVVFDGGSSVSKESFAAEKRFSFRIGRDVVHRNPRGRIGAVQFGTSVRQVAPLTANGVDFKRSVSQMHKLRGNRNINGGIAGCRLMLDGTVARRKVIVVMADGKAGIGGSIEEQVRGFRELGGYVYIVGTSKSNMQSVHKMKAARGKVYYVHSFENEARMRSVSCELGSDICSGH